MKHTKETRRRMSEARRIWWKEKHNRDFENHDKHLALYVAEHQKYLNKATGISAPLWNIAKTLVSAIPMFYQAVTGK